MFNYQVGTTPLQARNNMPFGIFFLIFFIIILIIVGIYFVVKLRISYKKSDKFLTKEKNRLTNSKDIAAFSKKFNLNPNETKMLTIVCKLSQCANINYLVKKAEDLQNIFGTAYKKMKKQEDAYSDEIVSLFFRLLYRLEQIIAQIKPLDGTKKIPAGTTVLYITHNLEKLPFSVIQNTNDALFLEIPDFLYNSPERPKPLEKMRFTFKTNTGLSCNFISRVIRYDLSHDKQIIMVIAHSEKFSTQIQRHYKRDFCQEKCIFSPVKMNNDNNVNTETFVVSDKKYDGNLINISAGGCCINTNLPIIENQYISIDFPTLNLDEKFIGIIRKTRRLADETFALHIQFTRISTKARNKIYAYVYKYEL